MPTKLIEVALPLDVINREAARQKTVRQGHPFSLHQWWSRKPLAACRAVLFAQLVDDPSDHSTVFPPNSDQERERQRLFEIIERLVAWEVTGDDQVFVEARAEIERCYPDGLPTIVDPFCGGGSVPLEAQRLGLQTDASDLNPVAVLITKALVELPAKFANRSPAHPVTATKLRGFETWTGAQGLAADVDWYGRWMCHEAGKRIGHLYPTALMPDGTRANVIAWLWARTVTCPNPACRSTMPLVNSFWLGRKKGREAWLHPMPDPLSRKVRFEIRRGATGPTTEGTIGRNGAKCLICQAPVPLTYVRDEGQAKRMGTQLLAIVAEGRHQRVYLPPSDEQEASANLFPPRDAPESELATHPQYMGVPRYGLTTHSDLFTSRQLTAMCTMSDLVHDARAKVLEDTSGDKSYADAVATYLAFAVSTLAI